MSCAPKRQTLFRFLCDVELYNKKSQRTRFHLFKCAVSSDSRIQLIVKCINAMGRAECFEEWAFVSCHYCNGTLEQQAREGG